MESNLKTELEAAERKLKALRKLAPVDARLQVRPNGIRPVAALLRISVWLASGIDVRLQRALAVRTIPTFAGMCHLTG